MARYVKAVLFDVVAVIRSYPSIFPTLNRIRMGTGSES